MVMHTSMTDEPKADPSWYKDFITNFNPSRIKIFCSLSMCGVWLSLLLLIVIYLLIAYIQNRLILKSGKAQTLLFITNCSLSKIKFAHLFVFCT